MEGKDEKEVGNEDRKEPMSSSSSSKEVKDIVSTVAAMT